MREIFSVSSTSDCLNVSISCSTRERAIDNSPASFTKRSMMSALTRNNDWRSRPSGAASSRTACAAAAMTAIVEGLSFWCSNTSATGTSMTAPRWSPALSRSSEPVKRSKYSSISSNLATAGSLSVSIAIILDSSTCASSPRRINPAMRALPFKVCKWRASSITGLWSAGRARQARMPSPTCGTISLASSRKIGSRSLSISSSMRRFSLPDSNAGSIGSSRAVVSTAGANAGVSNSGLSDTSVNAAVNPAAVPSATASSTAAGSNNGAVADSSDGAISSLFASAEDASTRTADASVGSGVTSTKTGASWIASTKPKSSSSTWRPSGSTDKVGART